MLTVEWLRLEARHPVDQVLEQPGHRAVVLRRSNDKRVVGQEPAAQLIGARGESVLLRVLTVRRAVEVAQRGEICRRAVLLDRAARELRQSRVERSGPQRCGEHQNSDRLSTAHRAKARPCLLYLK